MESVHTATTLHKRPTHMIPASGLEIREALYGDWPGCCLISGPRLRLGIPGTSPSLAFRANFCNFSSVVSMASDGISRRSGETMDMRPCTKRW